MFDECANDCEATLNAAILWSLKQTSKLINTAHLGYTPSDIASVIAQRVQELNDEFLALQKHEAIQLTPQQAAAIERGAKFCYTHSATFDPEDVCAECHHDELLAENPELVQSAVLRSIA
jgi:hypothetical protein